jgi:beta-N-acetylhexosaminidase
MSLPEERLDLTRVGTAQHKELERSVALDAVALLRNNAELLPLKQQQSVTVINCTKEASYQVLGEIRGVGPNQTTSAFSHFVEALRAYTENLSIVTAEDFSDSKIPELEHSDDIVIAVSENHTLPGMDFDQDGQVEIITSLQARVGSRLIVVALRDPYELANFPEVPVYLCSFSFRPCAAQAAVEVLFGQAEAKGRSPVSIPGTDIEA